MKHDMELYRQKRLEVAQCSDQSITFRVLAHLLGARNDVGISFEYRRAIVDDLLRRADELDRNIQPQAAEEAVNE